MQRQTVNAHLRPWEQARWRRWSRRAEHPLHRAPPWFLMGPRSGSPRLGLLKHLAVLFHAAVLFLPTELQGSFVALKWYGSIRVRVNMCYWWEGSASLYLGLRFEGTYIWNLVAVKKWFFSKGRGDISEQTSWKISMGFVQIFVTSFPNHVPQPKPCSVIPVAVSSQGTHVGHTGGIRCLSRAFIRLLGLFVSSFSPFWHCPSLTLSLANNGFGLCLSLCFIREKANN